MSRAHAKAGYRDDIRLRVRSSWEANYARILNARLADPADPLRRWEYEPDTFWFVGIKRGVRSYLPDFKLYETDQEPYYVEVKGYMDPKSFTKLKRMKKYHPKVRVELVGSTEYRALEKTLGPVTAHWEFPEQGK